MHQPDLPPLGQKQDHKVHFKAKRHHSGSCQKEHVEDETVGEVAYKTGSESMLIRSWSDTKITVEPTAEEAFLQAHFWKHTPCQGPHREKAANLLFPSVVDCCSCSIVSRWKEALGLTQGTPRGHSWTNWSFRCASAHSRWVPFFLLPRVCQITALGRAGRHPSLFLALPGKHSLPRRCPFPGNSNPPAPCHPKGWESAPLAREQANRQRRSSGAESKQREHQEKAELNTTPPLWLCTTRIRPLEAASSSFVYYKVPNA